MKIPETIKKKIVLCAKYYDKTGKLDNEIRLWMQKNLCFIKSMYIKKQGFSLNDALLEATNI